LDRREFDDVIDDGELLDYRVRDEDIDGKYPRDGRLDAAPEELRSPLTSCPCR
jgi:hypothetical protein